MFFKKKSIEFKFKSNWSNACILLLKNNKNKYKNNIKGYVVQILEVNKINLFVVYFKVAV